MGKTMPSHPEFYKDQAGQWRWRAVATNGRVVADSAEGYTRLEDARLGYLTAVTTTVEDR
jgi:uncharacterized protein YegP (UPF0339 family)